MSIKSIWFITSVSSLISLLGFCLVDLSIGEKGELKSPTISVWGATPPGGFSFRLVQFYIAKNGLELLIFLLHFPKCWD